MNGDEEDDRRTGNAGKKSVLRIPSYQKTTGTDDRWDNGSSSSSPSVPRTGDSSFSQAFSFIKNSDFYSPPPSLPPVTSHNSENAFRDHHLPVGGASSSSSSSTNFTSQNRNAILVSHRQRGNPLLKYIRNVRWIFADVVCDYMLGQTSCALYIRLTWLSHCLRLQGQRYYMIAVFSAVGEECGRYLETIKVYENKSADSIREQMDTDYLSRLTHALTTIRHVNKTDVITLGSTFGSLSGIIDSSMEDLARCPGIGEQKVRRLYDTFHKPFRRISSESTSIARDSAPAKIDENAIVECGEDSSKDRKEADLSVKSALSVAFEKYSRKIRSRERTNNFPERETENKNEKTE